MFVEFRDVQSLEIASVFWDMAAEERHHSTLLQQRYMERYGNASCALTEEDLQELIEVPRLEPGNISTNTMTLPSRVRGKERFRLRWRRKTMPGSSTLNWPA